MTNSGNNITGSNNIIGDSNSININLKEEYKKLDVHQWQPFKSLTTIKKQNQIYKKIYRTTSVIAILIPLCSLFSSLTNILHFFGINTLTKGFLVFMILTVISIVLKVLSNTISQISTHLNQEHDEIRLETNKIYKLEGDEVYVGLLEAQCTYQHCDGLVTIYTPPEREKENHKFIGCCSVDKYKHTYSIDNNFVLTPCGMNWQKLDPKK